VITDIFLNQLIQFYSNNATRLTVTHYAVLPHNIEIVIRPQITVTSLHHIVYLGLNCSNSRAIKTCNNWNVGQCPTWWPSCRIKCGALCSMPQSLADARIFGDFCVLYFQRAACTRFRPAS